MIFSCVVPFKRKKKKIPDLSLPPCINRSQTHECGNWDCGRAIPFLGIFVSKFSVLVLCSVSKNYALSRRKFTSAEIGGAGVDESILGIQHEILPGLLLHAVPNGLKHIELIRNCIFYSRKLMWKTKINPYYYTLKKKIFLTYKEIQMGSVAKSYIRRGFLILEAASYI
jgi:hypothetical protein